MLIILSANKKAYYDYAVLKEYKAGIVLQGCEVKSIRSNKPSLNGTWCQLDTHHNLDIIGYNIPEYKFQSKLVPHEPLRNKRLLLNKHELKQISKAVEEKGMTIIPLRLLIDDSRKVKVVIGLCKGKKEYDKRESIKKRQMMQDVKRYQLE